MKRSSLALAGALLLLMVAVALKGRLVVVPEVREPAAVGAFDARRAMARLSRILGDQRPHPVDSAATDSVRERLLAEMRALGLDPRVSDDFACNSHPRFPAPACARVRNIVATIGPRGGRHVLAAAHYDGSPVGPGAADDGIGVATLLEIAARLRESPPARPVTLLITDGEEAGLIGARAFVERDPLAGDVEAVVNFEARGVEGPAVMFETSSPNGAALAHFARSFVRPVANSLTADFYRLIPNATDVTVFEERGWTALNFAIIANETRYHSAGDDLSGLDPRSLQHMGDQGLAAVRSLASADPPENGGEVHYFDLAGRTLIVVPALFSFLLLAILLAYFGWSGWRRRAGLGLAAAAVVAALVDAAILAWLGQSLVGLFRSGQWWRAHPEAVSIAVQLSALAASIAAMLLARNVATGTLRAAFWLVLLLIAGVLAFIAPGGTILFVFPPLVAALGLGTRFERPAALVAAALLFLLFAPLLALIETLLGHASAWTFAPLAALILWPWLIELRPLFAATPLRTTAAGAAFALIGGWSAAASMPAYSEERQQRFSVEYGWDADARTGRWAVLNDGAPLPDAFAATAPWRRGSEVPWGPARRWTAPAPATPSDAPSLTLVSQREVPEGRIVTLRIESPGAQSVVLRAPPEVRLEAASAGGFTRPVGRLSETDPYLIRCAGRSCDGAVVTLLLESRAPAEWTAIGWYEGLPPAARPLLAARPRHARPQYSPDGTVAYRRFRF